MFRVIIITEEMVTRRQVRSSTFKLGLMGGSLWLVVACSPVGQNRYNYDEVGKAAVVEFGTVISSRPVDITGKVPGLVQ